MPRIAFALTLLALPLAAQDLPDHPDKLKYKPLTFDVPDASAFRVELKGGAAAYLQEDRSLPIVELQILFPGGSFWDEKGREGAAAMAGALMRTGGAGDLTPEEFDEEVDFIAAQIGVSIGSTNGTATLSVLTKNLDRGLELLGMALRTPRFDSRKLDLLKRQMEQGMKARNDDLAGIERREANFLLYGDFPLNRHPTKASVDSIGREELIAAHRRFVHPKHFVVAAAGDFDRASMVKKLEALFARWPFAAAARPSVPPLRHEPKPGVYTIHKPGDHINQGNVTIAHLGIDVRHPDVHSIRIMNYILGGGGFSSRLMQKVRTEEGLAYDVHSSYQPGILFRDVFAMRFQSKSETCLYAAQLCLRELERMQAEPPAEEEVAEAIQFFLDGFPAFFFSSPFHTMRTFANAEFSGIPGDYYRTYRERISKVTPAAVQAAAKEHCRRDRLAFVFVGNVGDIGRGDGQRELSLGDFGPVTEVALPDPLTLERPR
jgi:zinc protease